MTETNKLPRRSDGILPRRRERLDWHSDQPFRILSLDGGGIRGIFPAAILTDLESTYLGGGSVTEYFDLITRTSTGGILALGLAAGMKASELLDLYMTRGREIFPPECRAIRKVPSIFYCRLRTRASGPNIGGSAGGHEITGTRKCAFASRPWMENTAMCTSSRLHTTPISRGTETNSWPR